MIQVWQDLLVLQGRWENIRGHQSLRSREETRVTQDLTEFQVIQAIQDLLVPQVARREIRANQEKQANEANQAKTVTLVPQASLDLKESQACQALQAGMEREA